MGRSSEAHWSWHSQNPNCLAFQARVVFDQYPDRGPLAGSKTIRLVANHLESADVVAFRASGRVQPLHAFYHKDCLGRGESLLQEGVGSLMVLHDNKPN